jgi:hypothetical protein
MIQPVGPTRGLRVVLGPVAIAAALALLGVPGGTARPTSPIPGIPGLPRIPSLPKPDQTAVFDVIVEGEATDHNTSELSGTDAACLVKENGTVDEKDTYLRGKDVKLEFDRYGKQIIVKRNRGGELGDTSLAVKVTVHRTAEGSISYVPTTNVVTCPPASDIGTSPDCGVDKHVGGSPAMLLSWNDGRVSLEVTNRTAQLAPPDKCGEDEQTGITNQLFYAWPHPAKLQAVEGLPASKIFNRHIHPIAITMLSARGDRLPPHTVPWKGGQLTGTVTDIAENHATVRFIRVAG